MKILLFILISCNIATAQFIPKEFSGVIKLNDSSFIPYKLSLIQITNSIIEGSSITDEGGKYETKSKISGTYDSDSKILKFKEFDIVYTKSPYEELDFCFVHFEKKIKNFNKLEKITGNFLGQYVDGTKCIDGKLLLADTQKLEQKISKLKKKYNKPKFHKKKIDSVKLQPITKGEDLNVFVKSKTLILQIYDSGKIDDDQINLYINNKLVLENFSIKKEKKSIPITLKKKRLSIKVVAINEGASPPNTVKIEVQSQTDFISTKTALKTGEEATLSIIKK